MIRSNRGVEIVDNSSEAVVSGRFCRNLRSLSTASVALSCVDSVASGLKVGLYALIIGEPSRNLRTGMNNGGVVAPPEVRADPFKRLAR